MPEDRWPSIAVMGAGAVGCYFGGMLARAGAAVTLIGRPPHVEAIARDGLFLDSIHFQERVRAQASTDPAAARDAAVVLFCVKTLDTERAAQLLAPHLAPGAVVVSLQNGVDNVERIRSAAGMEALPAAVYVAAAMIGPGHVRHSGRGDLILGHATSGAGDARALASLFQRAGVPCRVSDNIAAELWTKLIMNCAYNAISALCRSRYGPVARHPGTRAVIERVVEETVAVARAAGVALPGPALLAEAAWRLGEEAMENAVSSTAQDVARGKRTEIDSLNGYVARRGAELGVATPVNETLCALVKLLEESSAAGAPPSP
jgi:2-dehydropantoate 2-reductase